MGHRCDLPAGVIRKRREALGLGHASVAAAAGISLSNYHDLEAVGTEMWTGIAIVNVLRLCRALRLTPAELFQGSESSFGVAPGRGTFPGNGLRGLYTLVAEELSRRGESASRFEDRVGWDIQRFLAATDAGLETWNIDCLADVCAGCGADWLAVLQGEFESGAWEGYPRGKSGHTPPEKGVG